jgi:hypothetical protein
MDRLLHSLPHLLAIRPILYGALMWGVCIYAFRLGGRDERIASFGIVVAAYLTFVLGSLFQIRYTNVAIPIVCVDAGIFIVLQTLALTSAKFWPLWLAGFHGVALLSHLAPLMPGMVPRTYYDAVALWGYPSLIILAFAVRRNQRKAIS